jgi:predicted DNA-binding transcriptional regulator AlpA
MTATETEPGEETAKMVRRFLVDAPTAAALCNVSRATWHRLNSAGKVPAPVKLGGRVLWRADELKAWTLADCPNRRDWEILQSTNGNGKK